MVNENDTALDSLTLDKKTIEVLVAHIIPTSKYFEARFDHMQDQIDRMNSDIKDFRTDVDRKFDAVMSEMDQRFGSVKSDMDQRFDSIKSDMDQRFDLIKSDMDQRFGSIRSDMDQRFQQVDRRFEQVDKRFEQVDKRLEQIVASIDRLGDKLDYRDERQRAFTMRMFTIAIGISILGALGAFLKSLGIY